MGSWRQVVRVFISATFLMKRHSRYPYWEDAAIREPSPMSGIIIRPPPDGFKSEVAEVVPPLLYSISPTIHPPSPTRCVATSLLFVRRCSRLNAYQKVRASAQNLFLLNT